MNAKFFKNWTRQARKGLLELAVLNDIGRRGMYGYEIERKFLKSEGMSLSGGTIYAILRRFRTGGLVKATQARSADGPGRKYYELTKPGQETLVQMNAYWTAITSQIAAVIRRR
jgi:PadR family transcriptional regulator, regulatory protein PadR